MSTLKADTIQSTGGGAVTLTKQSAAKAWVLAGNDASLVDSFNIASGADNGTGDYTYTFTSAISSANFESSATPSNWAKRYGLIATRTTTTIQLKFYDDADALADVTNGIAVHGDLA
jgi:hypothetical protein